MCRAQRVADAKAPRRGGAEDVQRHNYFLTNFVKRQKASVAGPWRFAGGVAQSLVGGLSATLEISIFGLSVMEAPERF